MAQLGNYIVAKAFRAVRSALQTMFADNVNDAFKLHSEALRAATIERRQHVALKNVVADTQETCAAVEEEALGKRLPSDVYEGDVHLRTLRLLLKQIDNAGWERSAHQCQFHSAFERCVARVLYKADWATQRPQIMQQNEWERCSSEVMISKLQSPPASPAGPVSQPLTHACRHPAALRQDILVSYARPTYLAAL